MHAFFTLLRRLVVCGALVMTAFSAAGCGGDDSTDPGPTADGVGNSADGGDSNDGDDGSDDSDGNDDEEGFDANLTPDGEVRAGQPITISFSAPVNRNSLVLSGSMAESGEPGWQSDTELVLEPSGWWPAGELQLEIEAESLEGETLAASESLLVTSPYETHQAAALVIGQPDFASSAPRQNIDAATADANTLDIPEGNVAFAGAADILYLADTGDSRVLGFHGIPTSNNANADFVIGQADFTGSAGDTTESSFRSPQGLSTGGGRLIVADKNSNRLMIYDGYPQGQTAASVVVGQQNFTDHGDSCQSWNMNHVHHHFVTPAGRLIVADGANNRVLIFNEIPTENGATPDLVLGQSSLAQCAPNDANRNGLADEGETAAADTLQHPSAVWSDDERLIVVDNYNNRVLVWQTFPGDNGAPADIVLGQAAMNTVAANDDNQDGEPDATATARVLNYPWHAWVEQDRLIISDQDNNRVLVWNEWPETSFAPADSVLGQPDFGGMQPNAGGEADARTLNNPKGVRVIDGKLFVTDMQNSRVLVYEDN